MKIATLARRIRSVRTWKVITSALYLFKKTLKAFIKKYKVDNKARENKMTKIL